MADQQQRPRHPLGYDFTRHHKFVYLGVMYEGDRHDEEGYHFHQQSDPKLELCLSLSEMVDAFWNHEATIQHLCDKAPDESWKTYVLRLKELPERHISAGRWRTDLLAALRHDRP